MKKLISMTRFVLQQRMTTEEINKSSFFNIQTHISTYYDIVFAYATFLKQPLNLGMFIPIDKHGNITEPLKGCCSGSGCGCMGMPINVSSREEMDEVLEAESRVLFKDCEVKNVKAIYKSDIDYFVVYYKSQQIWISWTERTIEDMILNGLELTENAIKLIGIE